MFRPSTYPRSRSPCRKAWNVGVENATDRVENADAPHLPRRLRLGGERRGEEGQEHEEAGPRSWGPIIGEPAGRGKCARSDTGGSGLAPLLR